MITLSERPKVALSMAPVRRLASRVGRYATSGAGGGALAGAGVGAATGVGSAVAQGEDWRTGAVRGIAGAAAGGAAGAVGGALGRGYRDTRLLSPGLSGVQAVGATAKRMRKGVANFGRRQAHGFTGKGDAAAIGMRGTARSEKKIELLRARTKDEIARAPSGKRTDLQREFIKKRDDLRGEGKRYDGFSAAGITSLPGIAKGLAGKNRKKTLKAMWGEASGGTRLGVGAAVGLPVAFEAPGLLRGDESATGGLSKKQKLMRLGTGVAGGIATGGLPIVPQLVAGGLVDVVGQQAMRSRKKHQALKASRRQQ